MPRPILVQAIIDQLVAELTRLREEGETAYPPRLDRLITAAAPSADPAQLKRALKNKAFTQKALIALKDFPTSPVALVTPQNDTELLASSPALLEAVLAALSDKAQPPFNVKQLVRAVARPLQQHFETALKKRISGNTLPASVVCETVKKTHQFHLKDRPPPTALLAARLLTALAEQKSQKNGEYPLTLERLIDLAGSTAKPAVLKGALESSAFRDATLHVKKGNRAAPIALKEDSGTLLQSDLLLEFLLNSLRSVRDNAFPLTKLVSKVDKPLQPDLKAALQEVVDQDRIPPVVGFVRINGKPHLFRWEDLAVRPPAAMPRRDFAKAFADTFERLDRARGSANWVSLVDLRKALPEYSRAEFDAQVHQLRVARVFTLRAAEGGLTGLTQEEQEAGIKEEGDLLLFVSRAKA